MAVPAVPLKRGWSPTKVVLTAARTSCSSWHSSSVHPRRPPTRSSWTPNASLRGDGGEAGPDLQSQFREAAGVYGALEEYRLLLQQPDEAIDLLEGAVLIARHRYPALQLEDVRDQIDDLAVQVETHLPSPGERYTLRVLQATSEHLFQRRGFQGNKEDYYDLDNSCINKVLERRLGIPITLALVYMEVAQRLGVPMLGVNIPGHFFLTPTDPDLEFLVDVFEGGEVCFLEDAESTLQRIYDRPLKLDPAFVRRKNPLPARTFLARMLNNLKQVYGTLRKEYDNALLITNYLRATRPGDHNEIRDAGIFLYYLKRYSECVDTLEEYLQLAPADSEDAQKVRRLLQSLTDD